MEVKLPPFVRRIIHTFEKEGYQIYIVGGVVRDLLIGRPAVDWDFTTNAKPEVILSLFPDAFYDNAFGTVGVVDPLDKKEPKNIYEITTFRKESTYSDRRHPDEVVWGETIGEDLVRRDFTMNAIALSESFKLIDPHGGQEDIKNKIIRAVGNPNERFQEDALRMMRAVRLATQLGFTIEPKTFQAIKDNLHLLDNVSAERIRDELLKLLSYPNAAEGYLILRNLGLAAKTLPEVEKGFGVEQKSEKRHHLHDVGTHSVLSLEYCKSQNPIVKLAALIHDLGKPIVASKTEEGIITFYNHEFVGASLARNIANRLRLSKKDSEKLVKLVRWHQFSVDERQTDKAVRRFIRNVGKENLEDILCVRTADRLGGGAKESSWRLERFKEKLIEVQKQPFTVADLKVDGHDVMKTLGLHPGPTVGKILNELFEEVVDGKIKNERKILLAKLKKINLRNL